VFGGETLHNASKIRSCPNNNGFFGDWSFQKFVQEDLRHGCREGAILVQYTRIGIVLRCSKSQLTLDLGLILIKG
jgi:hypothetical protein